MFNGSRPVFTSITAPPIQIQCIIDKHLTINFSLEVLFVVVLFYSFFEDDCEEI